MRLGFRRVPNKPGPRDRVLPPEWIAAVRRAGDADGVNNIQRELGIMGSGYYAAMQGKAVSATTYRAFELWYLERKVTPVTGPGLDTKLSMKAKELLLDAIRQASGDEDE